MGYGEAVSPPNVHKHVVQSCFMKWYGRLLLGHEFVRQ